MQDAQQERRKATFSAERLAAYMNDGTKNIEKRIKFAERLAKAPWSDKSRRYFLTREEEYVGGLRAATQIWAQMAGGELTVQDALLVRSMVDWPGGLELHIGMFIPTIMGQGTPEQQRELLPRCNTLEIIGTYAQTELGHGTFVRGLETTATYHAASEQFIMHSPTQTATKWWPGGLGKTATHAVVMARLYLNGRDHGPHAFIVQLRDLRTHRCLEGVEIGDIGPKFGYNGVDNGYLRFDHVLIPRTAMLSKFAQVESDGTYRPPPPENSKAAYGTMLFVRADIVRAAARYLAKAVTIATRYCCVRRQSAPAKGARELQVIDYENTAATLLPLIAASYVMHAAGATMWAAYEDYEAHKAQGRFDTLPELHALSSGLKALTTTATADGIEAARRTCGGHGFSLLSGLPSLFASYVQNCTWEGDNNVLLLQTARYVLKHAAGAAAGKGGGLPGGLAYLSGDGGVHASGTDLRDLACLEALFAARSKHLVQRALADIAQHPASGGKIGFEGDAWNATSTSLIAAGRAHCHVALLRHYQDRNQRAEASGAVGEQETAVLKTLGALWAVDLMTTHLGDFLEAKCLTLPEAGLVHATKRQLLRQVRPNAMALVDSWAFTDYELNSALGRYDGDVYTALLDMAKASPLNATDEGPAWETVLKGAVQRMSSKL